MSYKKWTKVQKEQLVLRMLTTHHVHKMNFALVITLLFCVVMKLAASTVGSFRTPGLCDPFNSFDDTFLLSTSSVKTRGMYARECLHNTRCVSVTVEGNYPDVTCKQYEQITNIRGLHLTPSINALYMEKEGIIRKRGSRSCTQTSPHEGMCDRRIGDLYVGEVLLVEDWLCSWDGKYQAKLQADGNFVVSKVSTGAQVWSSGITSQPSHRVRLLRTGELVIEDGDGNQLYSTSSLEEEPRRLKLGNDGVLVIFSDRDPKVAIWCN